VGVRRGKAVRRCDFAAALAGACDASARVARRPPCGHLGLSQGRPCRAAFPAAHAFADNVTVDLITTATARDEAARAARIGSFRLAPSPRPANQMPPFTDPAVTSAIGLAKCARQALRRMTRRRLRRP
jgi:hypothetical protein